jgi:hypothetical protein
VPTEVPVFVFKKFLTPVAKAAQPS